MNDFIDDVIDYLDTGPSTLGLDHACVCIANGKRPSQLTLALLAAGCNEVFNDSFCSRTKKHVKGLTSFLFPLDYTCSRINVSRPLSVTWVLCHRDNCTRVHRPQLSESKLTHDDTQVQKLLTILTGGIPLAFGCAERQTLSASQTSS